MVSLIKFSEFTVGGDLANSDITVGFGGGDNLRFNNPWTFLPPGSTGDRPVPAADNYYRMRLNTTLEVYEYYDPVSATWVEFSGSGIGTVNPGQVNDLAFYPANGTAISPVNAAADSVLVTNAGSVPSLSTTLPTGLSIPGATITASTAALTAGQVIAAPTAGDDITNKTYVDGLFSSGVQSITGTTNQVIASSPTGNVTLSLPQDIATGSTPTFSALKLTSNSALLDTNNNVILGINPLLNAVNYVVLFNSSTGNPLFIQAEGADPNIYLELVSKGTAPIYLAGGTSNTPVYITCGTGRQATTEFKFTDANYINVVTFPNASFTIAGTALALGGTNAALTASNGGILWSNATQLQILAGTATANLPLLSGSTATPAWGAFALSLGGALTTAGAHTLSGAFASTFTFTNTTSVTFPTSGTLATTATASGIVNSGLINQLSYYAAAGTTLSGLATANNGILVTSGAGVPSIGNAIGASISVTGSVTATTGVTTGISGTSNAINQFATTNNSANAYQTTKYVGGSSVQTFLQITVPAGVYFIGVECFIVNSRASSTLVGTSFVQKKFFAIARNGSGSDVVLDSSAGADFSSTTTTAGGVQNAISGATTIVRNGAESNTSPQVVNLTINPLTSGASSGFALCFCTISVLGSTTGLIIS